MALGNYKFNNIDELVQTLNDELRNEGYAFEISTTDLWGGFKRINIAKGTGLGNPNLYLDLRVGLMSPRGRTIEMAASKEGTYAIPGFARHIAGSTQVSSTLDTFKDYVRSVYAYADNEGKTANQAAWVVYQKGYAGFKYPGAEEFGVEQFEQTLYPKAGGVLGTSSSSGKRSFMASTVRYYVPDDMDAREYIEQTTKLIGTSAAPLGLKGYGPEASKWKAWVPMGTRYTTQEVQGMDMPQGMVYLPRGIEGARKSATMVHESRELSNVPMYRDPVTKKLFKITPSAPEKGMKFREGWTRSSVILPGETEGRVVLSKQLGLVDQPDLPGAMIASEGAFDVYDKFRKRTIETSAVGEEGNISYQFGVQSEEELRKLVYENRLKIENLEGFEMPSGTGMLQIGRWWRTKEEYKAAWLAEQERAYRIGEDPHKVDKFEPLLTPKLGYAARLGKPVLHIPEYFIPESEGQRFSNLPQMLNAKELARTDKLIKDLKSLYGDTVDIVQYSSIGSGLEDDPASVYMTTPIQRLTPVSAKTSGLKAYVAQKGYKMKLKLLGYGEQPQNVDFITQEGKIPARVLMSSFGILNMQAQKDFVDLFLPTDKNNEKQTAGVKAVKEYIEDAYNSPRGVGISVEMMARKWNEMTGENLSGDMLFSNMFKNVLKVNDAKTAKELRKQFGIGIPTTQWAAGGLYTKAKKEEMERLLAESKEPGASSLIRFQKANRKAELYQMMYKVPGGGQTAVLQAGISFVPEYPSQSSFINSKAIMALIQNAPETATEMGIKNELGNWGGVFAREAYSSRQPQPIETSANYMYAYLGLQSDLMEGTVAIPKGVIDIDAKLAAKLKDVWTRADKMPTHQAKLNELRLGIKEIDPQSVDLEAGTHLEQSWLLDPKSMTLVPPVDSIGGMEHYEEGIHKGVTDTFVGDSYMRLMSAAIDSSVSDPGDAMNIVGAAKMRFYERINSMFYPGGKRSKQMFRHLTGMTLPGTRGGRYQGMTELESGNAFASDSYIIRMLSNNGFKDSKEVRSILKYLDTSPDAFLPIFSQRFPDVSGVTTWMPIKLRSAKHLANMGVPTPKGPAAEDLFFMSTDVNRFQVGDFDADPAMQVVLPIYEMKDDKSGKMTGLWTLPDKVRKEFETNFQSYYSNTSVTDRYLEDLFGKQGTAFSHESLDVQRKNMFDYVKAATKVSSLVERLKEPGEYSVKDVLKSFMHSAQYQAGKGVSYITRTETQDIARGVEDYIYGKDNELPPEEKKIFRKSYEQSALTYQLYLDLQKRMQGGFTNLETMMNTFGIYNVQKSDTGVTSYHMSFKLSEQGEEVEVDDKGWYGIGGRGIDKNAMLERMVRNIANMPEELMTNEMLAWGFGTRGKRQNVLNALNDPKKFWTERKGADYANTLTGDFLSNRADILSNMVLEGKGEVGFNTPYYMSLAWRAIERLLRKQPEALLNRDVQIPWINGQVMPVQDIVKTKEYQLYSTLENLFVRGRSAPGSAEMAMLEDVYGERVAGMAAGVYKSWYQVTKGGLKAADLAQQEYGDRITEAASRLARSSLKKRPVIHASELGAMTVVPQNMRAEGWSPVSLGEKWEALYGVVLRSMGFPDLMQGREHAGVHFKRVLDEAAGESITGGIAYESGFEARHPQYAHIGKLSPRDMEKYSIRYQLGGVDIHGIPDFVRLNNGYFEITDTKSPAVREGVEYNAAFAEAKAQKYRYRIQQLAYAYGIQQMALDTEKIDKPYWREIMKKWGIKDKAVADEMRAAAAQGMFKLYIQPGKEGLDTPDFNPIEVPYNESTRAELKTVVKQLEEKYLTPDAYGEIAATTYGVLQTSKKLLPHLNPNYWERTSQPVQTKLYGELARVASFAGFKIRAAGGGRFDNIEGRRIRVGEGGPEDIIVTPEGGVAIVPTNELSDTRKMLGYLGERHADGDLPNYMEKSKADIERWQAEADAIDYGDLPESSVGYSALYKKKDRILQQIKRAERKQAEYIAKHPAPELTNLGGGGAQPPTQPPVTTTPAAGAPKRRRGRPRKEHGVEAGPGINPMNIGPTVEPLINIDVKGIASDEPDQEIEIQSPETFNPKELPTEEEESVGTGGLRPAPQVRTKGSAAPPRSVGELSEQFESIARSLDKIAGKKPSGAGRTPREPMQIEAQMRGLLEKFRAGKELVAPFEEELRGTVMGLLEQRGLGKEAREAFTNAGSASDVIMFAQRMGVTNEEFQRAYAGNKQLVKQAQAVKQYGVAFGQLQKLVEGPEGGGQKLAGALVAGQPEPEMALEELYKFMKGEGKENEAARWVSTQGIAGAEHVLSQKAGVADVEKTKLLGVNPETIKRYDTALATMNDKLLDYAKAIDGSKESVKAFKEANQAALHATVEDTKMKIENTKFMAGRLFDEKQQLVKFKDEAGKEVGTGLSGLIASGKTPTVQERQAYGQIIGLTKQLKRQEEAETKGETVLQGAPEGVSSKLGGLARRLLGGFGLMYLRSIGGLMTTGAYTGFGEREQLEAQMGQQFLGVGGQVPYSPMTEQQRILAVQYGGSGGRAIQAFKNAIMTQQQPLYQFGTTGLAGISAGGMAMWLSGEQGLNVKGEGMAGKIGLGVGLGVMAINQAVQIAGAYQDVQGTAMNLAVRRARGENLAGTALTAVGAGAATGALAGGAMTGFVNPLGYIGGALVGGGLGFLSNYQQIAAGLNPEIANQAALLQALAGRGNMPITSIVQQYGYGAEQAPYYARLAAEIEASKKGNLGISAEARGAASAYELRRGTVMTEAQRTRYAELAQAGFVPEAYAITATQAMGMSIFEANRRTNPMAYETTTTTLMERKPYESGTAQGQWIADLRNIISGGGAQVPTTYTATVPTASQSAITKYTQAFAAWAEAHGGADIGGEYAKAAFGAIGAMGIPGIVEYNKRMTAVVPTQQWRSQYNSLEEWQVAQGMKYGQELGGLQASGWLQPFQQMTEVAARRRALGLEATQVPTAAEYQRLHPQANEEQIYAAMRAATESNIVPSMVEQWRQQSISALGVTPTYAPNITPVQINQGMAQTAYGGQIAQAFLRGGLNADQATVFGGAFAQMSPQQFKQYQGLFSGNPLQQAAWAMNNQQAAGALFSQGTLAGIGGSTINTMNLGRVDIGAGGLTGMSWGTTSLALPMEVAALMNANRGQQFLGATATGPIQIGQMSMAQAVQQSSYNTAARMWGPNWNQIGGGQGAWRQAYADYGSFGAQAVQQLQGAQYQQAQAGIQIAQLQLQAEYQPKFWSIEDRQRALGYRQQEWGFQQQWTQLGVQQENFQFQTGMQQRQMGLQRGWQREDWAYQGQVRGLQWQWRQEDYGENLRFMTGRDRRLAERQMGRETTLHDLESEQIDKQKDRQKELWAMEDERFNQSVAYQQKLFDMQEDNLRKQEEFYQERKALEQEQVELNREYWQKQWDLSMQAAGAAAAYAATQAGIAEDMIKISQETETANGQLSLFGDESMADLATALDKVDPLFKTFVDEMERLQGALGGGGGGGGGSHTCPVCGQTYTGSYEDHVKNYKGPLAHPMQHGGRVQPGQSYLVGERGMEIFQPDSAGVIKPLDPWGTTYVNSSEARSGGREMMHLVVYLGDERLIDKVLEAVDQEVKG